MLTALAAALAVGLAAQTLPAPRPPAWKHMALDDSGVVWLALGAQSRTRVESWRNFGFGNPVQHDADFVLQRLLGSADLHLGKPVRAYFEVKSALLTDRDLPGGRRPSDADDFDLQQAFVEVAAQRAPSATLALRGGRQDLLVGRQRLVSPLDWTNARRTFDGLRASLASPSWTIDAFFARPVRVVKERFNRWDGTVDFGGLYAQRRGERGIGLDLYWLMLARDAAVFNGTTGRERRHTLGARFITAPGHRLEFDAEATVQLGSLGAGSIAAVMASVDVGRVLGRARISPRLHGGADYASGDRAAGGDVQTFNQLFPLGHAFLGFIDVVGRQNILAANVGLGLKPTTRITTDVTVHQFARASAADALYNAGGGVERAAGAASSLHVGTEVDATAAFRLGRYATALAGYCRFAPGEFIRQTGVARDIGFFYATVQLTY